VGISNSLDGQSVRISGEFESKLAIEERLEVLFIIAHDLAHKHVLEAEDSSAILRSAELRGNYIKGSKAS
jgi:hypothetical protein